MTSSGKLLHKGGLISVYQEPVALRDGGHTHFDIVKHPGGAVIAALNEHNQLCLLKQKRHAVGAEIWEVPAGCLESGEDPLVTAQRELEEEAGVLATEWQALGRILPSPGFSNEVLYLFKARGLSPGKVDYDDAEQISIHWIPLNDALAMAANNQIEDAKTLAILLKLVA